MVLVDTSVWIDYFNGRENVATQTLDALLPTTPVVVGDLILMEVLQGFRDDRDHDVVRKLLMELDLRVLSSIPLALKAADYFRTLRGRGVTVRKTVDCLIATYCIEKRLPLLHNDRDFDPFARYLGLEVVMGA
jgi:predicted nucleic acid-binding protein